MQASGLRELLDWNDAHRREGVEGGLVTLDEWASGECFGMYTPEFVTVAPYGWSAAAPMTQDMYASRFESKLPEVASLLADLEGVCVAGGAACMPFCGDYGDVDLFMFGVPHAARWSKANEVAGRVRAAFADARCITETLSEGLLTFCVFRGANIAMLKVQLVLRLFSTSSNVVHGFDVPSCCVLYDGRVTRMTRLAAFALAHRVNVVYPPYQSPSYVHRLAKYFRRGFALAFVGMRRGVLVPAQTTTLAAGEMLVTPRTVRGALCFGEVSLSHGALAARTDYEPDQTPHGFCARARLAHYAMVSTNAALVAAGKTRFVLAGESVETRGRTARTVLPLLSYAASEPRFEDALPRAEFDRHVESACRGAFRRGRVNVRALRRLFRLDDDEIAKFACAAARAASGRSRRVDASAALAKFRSALNGKYEEAAARGAIEWWVVVDPSAQFTASRSPRPMTPLEWFGASLAEHDEWPTKDETIDALLARLGRNTPSALGDDTCPLCYEHLGERNVVTLACGHSFHMYEAATGCLGLCAWTTPSCPMCRAPFARAYASARERAVVVPLEVEW
jgi:hypothetical protein